MAGCLIVGKRRVGVFSRATKSLPLRSFLVEFAERFSQDSNASGLGIDLDRHIAFCLAAMQRNADALGLAGPQENTQQG
jgi:predicted hydrolase (HD superfamily)